MIPPVHTLFPAKDLPGSRRGFSLLEGLIMMSILALLTVLAAEICAHARRVAFRDNQDLDADAQARAVLDRMAVDFAHIVQRSDVDYWLKDGANPQPGNDQMAFYSQVPGFSFDTGSKSLCPVSVVAYRVDARAGLQRFGLGLVWNMVQSASMPMVFSGESASSGGNNTLARCWPAATNGADDLHYEPASPQVFRMEYYYMLRPNGSAASKRSAVPWNEGSPANHQSVSGLRDVAAVGVVIAVIGTKARALVAPEALEALSQSMADFSGATAEPGAIEAQWQSAVIASGLPRAAVSSIRIYRRCFPLPLL